MKVLILGDASGPGGAAVNAMHLIDGLGESGHQVDFWQFPETGSGHHDSRWHNRYGEIREFPRESFGKADRALWRDRLRSVAPDVLVLTKGSPLTTFPALDHAAAERRLPIILIENEPALAPTELARVGPFTYFREWVYPGYRDLQRQQRLAAWRVSVSGITDRAMNRYLRWSKRGSSVIYPGIAIDEFYPDPEGRRRVRAQLGIGNDALVVGALSRLAPKKRLDLTIRIFAQAALPDDSVFLLAGQGPERETILGVVRELGIEHRVRIVDWVDGDDRRAYLTALDCFLMLSRSEGLGMALIEMLCCGGTAIATRCGGPDEVLTDRSFGLLVDDGDWGAVRRELERLSQEHSRAGQDPLAARRRAAMAERFEVKAQNAKLVALIESVAGKA